FLQAEDGIRDFHVTGVQTCALPIFVADAARGRDAAAQRLAEDPCLCVDGGDGRRAAVVGHEAAVDAGELRTGSAPFRAGCRGLRAVREPAVEAIALDDGRGVWRKRGGSGSCGRPGGTRGDGSGAVGAGVRDRGVAGNRIAVRRMCDQVYDVVLGRAPHARCGGTNLIEPNRAGAKAPALFHSYTKSLFGQILARDPAFRAVAGTDRVPGEATHADGRPGDRDRRTDPEGDDDRIRLAGAGADPQGGGGFRGRTDRERRVAYLAACQGDVGDPAFGAIAGTDGVPRVSIGVDRGAGDLHGGPVPQGDDHRVRESRAAPEPCGGIREDIRADRV